jgi:hypothetical protein
MSLPQIAASRMKGQHAPIRNTNHAIPGAVVDLVEGCLALEPDRRPHARDAARRLAAPFESFDAPAGGFAGFLHELKRRRVYQVLAAYAVVGYGVLEVADLILPALPVPEGTFSVVVAMTLAGFPVALVLSWLYDIGSTGIHRTDEGRPSTRGALPWIGLAVSIAIAALIGWAVLR